ncbi:MAG: hypothetical protein V4608_04100 [Bacteroidota bacterium]
MKAQRFFLISISVLICSCASHSSDKDASTDTLTTQAIDSTVDLSHSEAPEGKSYDQIGFELLKTESFGNIKIGLTDLKTVELIGEPQEKSKTEEWEADGETHQTWNYKQLGITINMIGKGALNQVVNTISITAPCSLKTSKQIGIGSSKQEVQSAYDLSIDKANLESEALVAGTVYGGMIFNFENGKVKTIFLGSVAE